MMILSNGLKLLNQTNCKSYKREKEFAVTKGTTWKSNKNVIYKEQCFCLSVYMFTEQTARLVERRGHVSFMLNATNWRTLMNRNICFILHWSFKRFRRKARRSAEVVTLAMLFWYSTVEHVGYSYTKIKNKQNLCNVNWVNNKTTVIHHRRRTHV